MTAIPSEAPASPILLLTGASQPAGADITAALNAAGFAVETSAAIARSADLIVDARALIGHGATEGDDTLSRLVQTAASPATSSLVLLLPSRSGRDRHARAALANQLRIIALAAAPAMRINAIGIGQDMAAVAGAVSLVRNAPRMIGQVIWLCGRTQMSVETAALVLPDVSERSGEEWRPGTGPKTRRVFIRDLVLACRIGVFRHEQTGTQQIRINIDLAVDEPNETSTTDRLSDVVCYDRIATGVRDVVAGGHVALVETLAERIAGICLEDLRVASVRVRIEKLDVYADAESAGVEIERRRQIP